MSNNDNETLESLINKHQNTIAEEEVESNITSPSSLSSLFQRLNVAYSIKGWKVPATVLIGLVMLLLQTLVIQKGFVKGLAMYKKWADRRSTSTNRVRKDIRTLGELVKSDEAKYIAHRIEKFKTTLAPPTLTRDMNVIVKMNTRDQSIATLVWNTLADVLEISDDTLAPFQVERGKISFMLVPIPFDKVNQDIIQDIIDRLAQQNINVDISLDTSFVDDQIQPELVINVQ